MMNVMHFSERYGYLVINGKPMPDEQVARRCGTSLQEYLALLGELDAAGIPRRTPDGCIYSKRMVEDSKRRKEWRKRQQRHRDSSSVTSRTCHSDVTPISNLQSSSAKKEEKAIGARAPKQPPFKPPEFTDVASYMVHLGVPEPGAEARKFIDHHAQRKWRVSGGRGPVMTDWRAAVRTWQSNIGKFGGSYGTSKPNNAEKAAATVREAARVAADIERGADQMLPKLRSGV
jgi:hypothetical protein